MGYGTFDASQHEPRQGGQAHPVGKFPFTITNTEIEPTKDGQNGMFTVTFTSPSGEHKNRYCLWHTNPQTVQIAHGQLSALCRSTGVLVINFDNAGAELRNARGIMEIGYQKGHEPTPERPSGGYVELKKVYDANGNEPGKPVSPAPQPQANSASWPGPNPQPQASSPVNHSPSNGGWQPQEAQAPQQPPNEQKWQQRPMQGPPPWASK